MVNRSSQVVGRDDELKAIENALADARGGRGGTVFLVGESGIGKTRLAAAAADIGYSTGMRLLRGRGSVLGPAVPYRSLTEALLSLVRAGDPIDLDALGPYRPILAGLVPDLGPAPDNQEAGSLVILAEAVLRLTALAGEDRGCLLILDDLQDADLETLAVVDYLTDNLIGQRTVLVGTIRADQGQALSFARAAGVRGSCTVLELGRLGRSDMRRLAAARLGVDPARVPEPVADLLWAGGGGNPFRTEEMLDGMVDSGLLTRTAEGWLVSESDRPNPPATLLRSVGARLDAVEPSAREVLLTCAVLGKRFPLTVVQEATGLTYRDLLSHLHGDNAAHLVAPDEQTPDWYAFQHALIVDALLTLVPPAERAALCGKVADAVEAVYPGLPGEWCQLTAALRLDSGQPLAAGRLWATAGHRALGQGAAQSAVALLGRACDLLAPDTSERATALEAQLHALAEAGEVDRALAMVYLLDEVTGLAPDRRARLHTRLAWVAVHAGRAEVGLQSVAAARALLGPAASAADTAAIDVVAAHLEMDVPGPDQLAKAEEMARRAAVVAEGAGLPAVACQAWQLLGALTRQRDPVEATALLERSRAIAVEHNLPIWEVHALVRLGLDDALRDGGIERLELARDSASRIGAVTARYQAEVNIAMQLILRGDFAEADRLTAQVLTATTRLRLVETTQYMLLHRTVLSAHRGRRADMEAALGELRQWGGEHAQHAPRIHGLAGAFCALMEENQDLARAECAAAVAAEDRNPTTFHLSGRYGLNLLLRSLADDISPAEFATMTSAPASRLRWDRMFSDFAAAVLASRAGRVDDARAAVVRAAASGAPYAMARHLGLRLVAPFALAGEWGSPIEWLREAEEHFHRTGVSAVAGACRTLLRKGGASVSQRREGTEEIPAALRSAGVTVREYEVLRLLVDRLCNREIADALHLSPRTVEKHVSSLIAKTGEPNRIALSKYASATVRS
ncbi:DNA-binding CsgD family transcriptional regulator [Actinokineospora baliensis]|uniref:ATP-binding protein n=1 Tax=Actinokineospora baliensis TaxID=547056 RepID=UPI0019580E60|nr:AAA family ATPase [Actinokineospora baliensis]MBM7774230.1 DNA-binding CsgD family transcriptional regulator [Actinokineospora baliensis]